MFARFRDWYRVRPGYWFAQKRYGWGAVPVTWQGWALVLSTLLASGAVARLAQHNPLYQFLFVPLFTAVLWLCWIKTDGGWQWRWGNRD